MEENNNNSEKYINELEEKIIDLSLRLKSKKNELSTLSKNNKKTIGRLVHNLKNPVGVIYSFSDMILEDLEDYSKEKLEKHLQIINTSANFSIQLLSSIAKYSQFQSQNIISISKSINYIELVENVLNEFSALSIEKNIKIERIFPATPIILTLNASDISFAIKNIVHNAFRYSNKNTTIRIEIKENTTSVETVVTDEGIGILQEDLPQVLNEFFVVNTYSEDKQKCIGLGLTIVNEIMDSHNGKISITSNYGVGTAVTLSLNK